MPGSHKDNRRGARARIAGLVLLASAAFGACSLAPKAIGRGLASDCSGRDVRVRTASLWVQTAEQYGKTVLPGVTLLTGADLKPFQTRFCTPELADPYVTFLRDSVIISGTAQYYLKFDSLEDLEQGGPYRVVWSDFFYPDGTQMEGDRYYANSWDLKPSLWSASSSAEPRLWDPVHDTQAPLMVWYGGHMRPRPGQRISRWPDDNFSRDVFAFVEKSPGKLFSQQDSIFSARADWPRGQGNYLGHRYGHQIVMVPRMKQGQQIQVAAVFYEEVTEVRSNGSPATTKIFMDEMTTPFQAQGKPVELISPFNPLTGRPYPSTIREDGSVLVEGPLYFRFVFENELWEAIGFSAGSFYASYPAAFAARKVSDGLQGKPYVLDLNDEGSDLRNAGAELGEALHLAGGPGRPAVIVDSEGLAIPGSQGDLQLLLHGYRKDILPDNDYGSFPTKYPLDQMFRVMILASLKIEKGPTGALRFKILVPPRSTAPEPLPLTRQL